MYRKLAECLASCFSIRISRGHLVSGETRTVNDTSQKAKRRLGLAALTAGRAFNDTGRLSKATIAFLRGDKRALETDKVGALNVTRMQQCRRDEVLPEPTSPCSSRCIGLNGCIDCSRFFCRGCDGLRIAERGCVAGGLLCAEQHVRKTGETTRLPHPAFIRRHGLECLRPLADFRLLVRQFCLNDCLFGHH